MAQLMKNKKAFYSLEKKNHRTRLDSNNLRRNSNHDGDKRPILVKSEVDRFQAWLTLACIFFTNATTLGSLKVYGLIFAEIVAQNYYNREEASWPISTASTVQNLAGLLTPILALKISWRSIEIIQTILFVLSNFGAYFSRSLTLDIFCLGILQGIALSIRYNMNVVINNEYFVKYRATAMGVSLAGSTCGVFVLKPIISYVLDSSNKKFRNAYSALAIIMSFNIIFNLMIRKPRHPPRSGSPDSQDTQNSFEMNSVGRESGSGDVEDDSTVMKSLKTLIKNPSIHCIWIMQTVYFYISRTYTIFIVDYGVDSGFSRAHSRNLLDFWVYGEISGRLLLGGFVDSRIISLKWNIVLVNMLLGICGFALLLDSSSFQFSNEAMSNATALMTSNQSSTAVESTNIIFFWYFGMAIALVAALSSLVNMLIIPFGQEYLGKKNVPWAFAMGSVVTSIFLLVRPYLIGWSRDTLKSYEPLIIVMSSGPLIFALLFTFSEPFLKSRRLLNIFQDNYP